MVLAPKPPQNLQQFSTFAFQPQPQPPAAPGPPQRDLIGEYEDYLEMFLIVNSINDGTSFHGRHKSRSTSGLSSVYSEDELALIVPTYSRMRMLASDSHFGRFRWAASPEKRFAAMSFSSAAAAALGHGGGISVSDSDIIMGIFLHLCNHLQTSSKSREAKFSDSIFAEDASRASRQLTASMKRLARDEYAGISSSGINSVMPCITRTSSSPPHFNIFMGELSVGFEDYAYGGEDEGLVVTECKVKPGRQNCFHAIIVFMVACVHSDNVSSLVIRFLLRNVLELENCSSTESLLKGLEDIGFFHNRQ